jgi:hypothetical protein
VAKGGMVLGSGPFIGSDEWWGHVERMPPVSDVMECVGAVTTTNGCDPVADGWGRWGV